MEDQNLQQTLVLASAPSDNEAEVSAPTNDFSLASFASNPVSYPDLHRDGEKYVQKSYEERRAAGVIPDSAPAQETITLRETPEFEQFKNDLERADRLREANAPRKKPNWAQKLFTSFRQRSGERSVSTKVLDVNDPDFYSKYFNTDRRVRTPLAFNPEYSSPQADILKRAMSYGQPASLLASSGLTNVTALQLSNIGLTITDFRIQGRSAADMQVMFTDLDKLKQAGFNAKSFDARYWSLEKIANAYNTTTEGLIEQFDMSPSDLVSAGLDVKELDKYGAKAEHFVGEPNFFKLLISSNLSPSQFMNKFEANPRHFFDANGKSILKPMQVEYLKHAHDWDNKALLQAGFDETEIKALRGECTLRAHP